MSPARSTFEATVRRGSSGRAAVERGGLAVLGLVLAFAGPGSAASPAGSSLKVSVDEPLPSALVKAHDVRWATGESIFVSSGKEGTFELPLRGGKPQIMVAPLPDSGPLRFHSRLGVSKELFVVAAPITSLFWRLRSSPSPENVETVLGFNYIVDLDVSGNRLLLLGAQQDDQGRFARDGAIAWTANVGARLTDLKPLLYSTAGVGARPMDACGIFELGKVRFLADGSMIVAPGVEPGVFHYGPDGKLLASWQADIVGFDAGCGLSDDEMYKYSASLKSRYPWLSQRRVLDEILPLPSGPGFVVRTRAKGKTTWELKILRDARHVETVSIPLSSPSEFAHLRGDVREGRLVLLVTDRGDQPPQGFPRFVVAELPDSARDAKGR